MEAIDILELPTLALTDLVDIRFNERYFSTDLGIPIIIGTGMCGQCCLLDKCDDTIDKGFVCGKLNMQPLTIDNNHV